MKAKDKDQRFKEFYAKLIRHLDAKDRRKALKVLKGGAQ